MWSLWLNITPLWDAHVLLCISLCGKHVKLIVVLSFTAKSITVLGYLIYLRVCAPVVLLWVISLQTLAFRSPSIIFVSFIAVESYALSSDWQNSIWIFVAMKSQTLHKFDSDAQRPTKLDKKFKPKIIRFSKKADDNKNGKTPWNIAQHSGPAVKGQ